MNTMGSNEVGVAVMDTSCAWLVKSAADCHPICLDHPPGT